MILGLHSTTKKMIYIFLVVLCSNSLSAQDTKLSLVGAFGHSFKHVWSSDEKISPVLELGIMYQWPVSEKHGINLHTGFLVTNNYGKNKNEFEFSGPFSSGEDAAIEVTHNTKIKYISIPFLVSIKLNKYRPFFGMQAQLLRSASRLRLYRSFDTDGNVLESFKTEMISSYPMFNAELIFGFQRIINNNWSLSLTYYEGIIHLDPNLLLDRISREYTTSRISLGVHYTFCANR